MREEINVSPDLKNAVAMLKALPLLPANRMQEGLDYIRTLATTRGVNTVNFQAVCERIQTHWLNRISPEVISVYRKQTRTNNGLESSFKQLNAYFNSAHPNIWHIIGIYNFMFHLRFLRRA